MWTKTPHRYDQVSHIFFEPFIVWGYRSCPSSLSSCIASAFKPNNETLNFWTHFIPIIPLLFILVDNVFDVHGINDRFTWPLIVFLLSVILYMLASAVAHLFNNLSVRHRYVMFFIDYCGVSINMFGSCVAYSAYVFTPELLGWAPILHRVYLTGAVLTSIFSTLLASTSRFASGTLLHYGRLPAFAVPYIWGTIPVFCRVYFMVWNWPADRGSDVMFYHVAHLCWIAVAAAFYATRFPECVWPGSFDVVGHSHQFFHVATALCSYSQYLALKLDMKAQRDFLSEAIGEPTFGTSFGPLIFVLLLNFIIIWGVSYAYLFSASSKQLDWTKKLSS